MTPEQIRSTVAQHPVLAALAAAQSWQPLAEAITALELREPSAERIDAAMVMSRMSNADSATLFGTLKAAAAQNPLVDEALLQLRGPGIDLSHANARAMIDALFLQSNPALCERIKLLGTRVLTCTANDCEAAVGLVPVTTWTGASSAPEIRNGMVHVTLTYTSGTGATKIESTHADDLTPGRVAEIIARRVDSLQRADAALALFGG